MERGAGGDSHVTRPPLLIVTSRLADERLWAEVLNLGAHDVLAKPFNAEEVVRVLDLTRMHRTKLPPRKPHQSASPLRPVAATVDMEWRQQCKIGDPRLGFRLFVIRGPA